jgi:hypothetical protein
VLPQEPIRRLALCSLLNYGSFGRTLCERRPAFFDEMGLRRAREQQQQVDAGGGQAASQTPGRRQVEFSDRGGTSEECRGGPWTPICIKDHPASIPAINDAPHFLRSALSGFECRLGLDLFHQSLQWTPTDLTEISLIIRHEAPAVADAVDVAIPSCCPFRGDSNRK